MDILSYLFELLQQRKEVGIAALGTFYKKKYPGRYDKEKQSFLPPGFTLLFTSEVKEESILEAYISAKRNISAESAQYYIAQFVEEVNEKLAQEHEAVLDRIGRLYFTEHEGLSFEPAQDINYGSEFYGLPALPETHLVEVKTDEPKHDEPETFDEIAEAPVSNLKPEEKEIKQPEIENIELDEVNDDFKNTLKHTLPAEEVKDVPEFIKEQHADHPNRFGHTPEDEEAVKAITDAETQASSSTETEAPFHQAENVREEAPVIEAPEFIKEQHADHPDRFGHTPEDEEAVKAIADAETQASLSSETEAPFHPAENVREEVPVIEAPETESAAENQQAEVPETTPSGHIESVIAPKDKPGRFSLGYTPEPEEPKTYVNLEEEAKPEEPVIEAPQFIKAQHAEHPNRFGHDPVIHEEERPQGMSTWLLITIVVLILVIIAAITYLVKPELFTGQAETVQTTKTVTDTAQIPTNTLKAKQDSTAKTDSILKANQVQQKVDTAKKSVEKPVVKSTVDIPKETNIVSNTGPSTFNVIAASFQSEKKALVFIKQMEKLGLKASIAKLPGRLKKVSIASFKTQKEAEEQKEILQKKLKGKGFFVQQVFNNTQP